MSICSFGGKPTGRRSLMQVVEARRAEERDVVRGERRAGCRRRARDERRAQRPRRRRPGSASKNALARDEAPLVAGCAAARRPRSRGPQVRASAAREHGRRREELAVEREPARVADRRGLHPQHLDERVRSSCAGARAAARRQRRAPRPAEEAQAPDEAAAPGRRGRDEVERRSPAAGRTAGGPRGASAAGRARERSRGSGGAPRRAAPAVNVAGCPSGEPMIWSRK